MTVQEVMQRLHALADPATQKIFNNHGANNAALGVKIADLKALQKGIKKNHLLALELYATGVSDAMYLAGLVSDPKAMTEAQLRAWAAAAHWPMISEYTVPWTASESHHGWALALEWIDSATETIAAAGWATLSNIVLLKPDAELNPTALRELLERVEADIHTAQNRVRYAMNGFVIALGCGVPALTTAAKAAAGRIGVVLVDIGGRACKVPDAAACIQKVEDKGALGMKRKTAFC